MSSSDVFWQRGFGGGRAEHGEPIAASSQKRASRQHELIAAPPAPAGARVQPLVVDLEALQRSDFAVAIDHETSRAALGAEVLGRVGARVAQDRDT